MIGSGYTNFCRLDFFTVAENHWRLITAWISTSSFKRFILYTLRSFDYLFTYKRKKMVLLSLSEKCRIKMSKSVSSPTNVLVLRRDRYTVFNNLNFCIPWRQNNIASQFSQSCAAQSNHAGLVSVTRQKVFLFYMSILFLCLNSQYDSRLFHRLRCAVYYVIMTVFVAIEPHCRLSVMPFTEST